MRGSALTSSAMAGQLWSVLPSLTKTIWTAWPLSRATLRISGREGLERVLLVADGDDDGDEARLHGRYIGVDTRRWQPVAGKWEEAMESVRDGETGGRGRGGDRRVGGGG